MTNYTPPGVKPTIRVEMTEYQRQVVRDLVGRVIGWPDAIKSMGKFQINPE